MTSDQLREALRRQTARMEAQLQITLAKRTARRLQRQADLFEELALHLGDGETVGEVWDRLPTDLRARLEAAFPDGRVRI